jgi:hypothetical protein
MYLPNRLDITHAPGNPAQPEKGLTRYTDETYHPGTLWDVVFAANSS